MEFRASRWLISMNFFRVDLVEGGRGRGGMGFGGVRYRYGGCMPVLGIVLLTIVVSVGDVVVEVSVFFLDGWTGVLVVVLFLLTDYKSTVFEPA